MNSASVAKNFPVVCVGGSAGRLDAYIRLLNLAEEHTMSFMYDSETGQVSLCDGFYNHLLLDSPYQFSSGNIKTSDMFEYQGLIRAGKRPVRGIEGTIRNCQVFIEFLPHSTTDYTPSLGEGDFPGVFQLVGRLFEGKLREEQQRLENGTSAITMVFEKVRAWQIMHGKAECQAQALDRRFARVLIELARDRPELIRMRDVKRNRPLITQGHESDSIYLVLNRFLPTQHHRPSLQLLLPLQRSATNLQNHITEQSLWQY